MAKHRRTFKASEKVNILRRHLLGKISVAALCHELQLNPTVFYRWQKYFFENGAIVFCRSSVRKTRAGNGAASDTIQLRANTKAAKDHARWMVKLSHGTRVSDALLERAGDKLNEEEIGVLLGSIRTQPCDTRIPTP